MIFVCFITISTAYIFTIIYTNFECSLLDLGVGFGWGETFSSFSCDLPTPSVCSFLTHAFESYPDYNVHHFLPALHCGTHLPYYIYLVINYKLSVSNVIACTHAITSQH